MDKATYGLIGVVVGFALPTIRDWWVQHHKTKKDAEYLSIQVVCMLDRFVAGCVDVVCDDGLLQGQRNQHGYCEIQVTPPQFQPELLKVEWKSLPTILMHDVLSFSSKVEVAENRVDAAFEHATPPDLDEGFGVRQYQYAKLGLDAIELAKRVRQNAGFPPYQNAGFDSAIYFKEKLEECRMFQA